MNRILVITVLALVAGCYSYPTVQEIDRDWTSLRRPDKRSGRYAAMENEAERLREERLRSPPTARNERALEERIAGIERRIEELLHLARRIGGRDLDAASQVQATIDALRKENADLKKKVAELTWVINEVQKRIEVVPLYPLHTPPKIDGRIVGVSSRINLVVINVGEEDGVRVGFEFTIHRKGGFLGKLVVEKVYPRQSACRVTSSPHLNAVRQGDEVSTRVEGLLPPPGRGAPHPLDDRVETPMPDGRVVRVDIDQGYAYIDLGSKDGVRSGQRFHVYSVLKGGRRRPKGEVRIIRVEKDFCRCSILSMTDHAHPMVMGDYIWNKFFVPGRKLTFVFIGNFGGDRIQYTREQLKKLVLSAGHVVAVKVTPDAHYAVLGEDYEKDPEYKLVLDWHIEQTKPRDLFDYFGFGRFK